MKRNLLFAILLMAFTVNINAQDAERMTESCTSIMVGKQASADGSVITSHTCDARYRTWMTIVPARDYERDTVVAVYRDRFHTTAPGDVTGMVQLGTTHLRKSSLSFQSSIYWFTHFTKCQLSIG